MRRLLTIALSLIAGLASLAERASGHEIPNQILVQALLQTGDEESELVVRVPLVLLQGLDLPTRRSGAIEVEGAEGELRQAAVGLADQLRLVVDDQVVAPERYAYRVSLPDERVFETFESARRHVLGPDLPPGAEVTFEEGFFDAYFAYPAIPDGATPVLDITLGAGYGEFLQLVLRYLPADGGELAYRVHGEHGPLELDPGVGSAASTFTRSGIEHILSGIDHLLFLLCLVLPFRLHDIQSLVAIVTGFTIAHSITLILTALGYAPGGSWFGPAIEATIAASIVYMALENLIVAWRGGGLLLRRRWLITSAFGLIHGFGFAFVLSDQLQFAGDHLLVSLIAFNLGVEIGQIGFLLILLPVLELARRVDPTGKILLVLGSVLVAHTAWHWTLERLGALPLEELGDLGWQALRPVAAVVLIVAGILTLGSRYRRARRAPSGGD